MAAEPLTMHAPAAVQVLELMVPASVPPVPHTPPPAFWVQVPDQTVVMPHGVPLGLKVHALEVGIMPVTTHCPLALQVLELMVPASVPVMEQPPPVCTHVPDQVVVEVPQACPAGLKAQLCDTGIGDPVTQVPLWLQVLGVVVPIWVPVREQPPPVCAHEPYMVVLPQSRPLGS